MLIPYENRAIYRANKPIDFRMSMDGLLNLIQREIKGHIADGSIYVFLNKNKNRAKCLFCDATGVVLYYKRLHQGKFEIKGRLKEIDKLTREELDIFLSGFESDNRRLLVNEG